MTAVSFEQRSAGDALLTKERLFSMFLDAMPAQVFIKDLNENLLYSNAKCPSTNSDDYTKNYADSHSEPLDIVHGGSETSDDQLMPISKVHNVSSFLPKHAFQFTLRDEKGKVCAIGELIMDDHCARKESDEDIIVEPQIKRRKVTATQKNELPECQKTQVKLPSHNYTRLFKNMPMGAAVNEVITDIDGNPIDWIFREVNPSFEELTLLKGVDILDKKASECLPELRANAFNWIFHFGQVALTGQTYKFDEQYDRSLKKWFSGITYQPTDRGGIFVTLFLDVTDRVKREEDLKESEERHRNLFESMMQGVVYQKPDGSVIASNPSAQRILGVTEDQLMGRSNYDPRWKTIKEDGSDFPAEEHPIAIAVSTGKQITDVLMGVYHPTNDSHHWINVDAIPRFHPGEDKPFQVYATFTDMTQKKEFERKLFREKERAEMADRLKSAFLANMSHEIRTPLNGIIGHIDLALSNMLSTEYRAENLDGLRVARQSGELLITIIQDILDLSKIEAAQLDIEFDGFFKIQDLVDQTKSIGDSIILQKSKSISLEVSICKDIHPYLYGDVFRVQQILNNLISNAVKFTDTGRVIFEVAIAEDMLEFKVSDTGKGIPPEHLESVFEPFRQVEFGDTRKHGGTGLGLTISRKLVEMMGGTIWLRSTTVKPTNGSTFTFTFPYRKYYPSVEETGLDTIKTGDTERHPIKTIIENGKILVAEDETVSRRMVKRMLEISGYEVLLAQNGLQAVEMFKSRDDIALVLMDVQMPILDGLSATKQIRDFEQLHKQRSIVPIIALSANAMKGDNERGIGAGMTGYLTKPVNIKLLKETLVKHLGEPQGSVSTRR